MIVAFAGFIQSDVPESNGMSAEMGFPLKETEGNGILRFPSFGSGSCGSACLARQVAHF